ncbi:hypothetical protein Gasu2_51840 [Galdieria sulphuraria]|uniref:Uncharacterized protein n=1 Tax=Galdieria sulphuraria TaxID=130081 RepID=M2XU77_GALSU|nr:uncharacterized protein Gasu_54130 [Galdieria sulphuraria]EME26959.1 hypothetical protein Gasu_54130 [Galdieria sulphuraria]GJD11027.1 hypothetical protein Gasu2_51840 [Galdieria sulphuraria]|eukprot:XP_005703479.1 hypothetical protein Gasu_54130 [Galdieria sulphuraria]
MKFSNTQVTILSIVACCICIAAAAPLVSRMSYEEGTSYGYIQPSASGIAAGVSQSGESSGQAGNYQAASGESTIEVPSVNYGSTGINSLNEESEGSSGQLSIPTTSPALVYFPTQLIEPSFAPVYYYYSRSSSSSPSGSYEEGTSYGYIQPSASGIAAGVSQSGESSGQAGNYQAASGESTIEVPSVNYGSTGINSLNEESEGSSGQLSIPTTSPALVYFPTQLIEPSFAPVYYYYSRSSSSSQPQNYEEGTSFGYIQPSSSGIAAGVTQSGETVGESGNYQVASGESTIEVPSYSYSPAGVNSLNEESEGSSGQLSIPTISPALVFFPTQLIEPAF